MAKKEKRSAACGACDGGACPAAGGAGRNPRLGRVGGGALIEGVMMRAGEDVAITCRAEDGSLHLTREKRVPLRKKHKWLNIPLLRGIVNFIESMALSMHSLNVSAETYGGEIEEGRVERWMKKHLGIGFYDIATGIGAVLGVLLSVALFLYLPKLSVSGIELLFSYDLPKWAEGAIEGGVKVAIFVLYIFLVSLIPDIRRTFAYHGAEHKSIACYEAGGELTPENAKKHSRFHPRCGTSFMFVMILLGVALGIGLRYILPAEIVSMGWLYTLIRLALLPLVVGLGFEFIMFAGKHDGIFVRVLSAPGLWMQRLTTSEPDESMLEVAILSLKAALPDEFADEDFSAYEKKEAADKQGDGEAATEGTDAPAAADVSTSVTEGASVPATEGGENA